MVPATGTTLANNFVAPRRAVGAQQTAMREAPDRITQPCEGTPRTREFVV
jgi:hypothetical protein